MKISGLQKLTLLDFPGHTACTVFTPGCNFRCPFCHNASLVAGAAEQPEIGEDEFFAFLKKRKGLLDGVAVTGGEPTLQSGLGDFLKKIKDLGFAVKLDTNGYKPDVLRDVVEKGLVDFVAMDVKASPENYAAAAGLPAVNLSAVKESVEFLKSDAVPHEFRTTYVKGLHTVKDAQDIGVWLRGETQYFLQNFKDSGDILCQGYDSFTDAEMAVFLDAARVCVPSAQLRGMA